MRLPSTARMARPGRTHTSDQPGGEGMTLRPRGQRRVDGSPRFGGPFKPPAVPASPALEITGAVREPVTVAVSELSTLPRMQRMSDFHCVAGWSATGLRWEGVGFTAFYGSILPPQPS